MQRLQRKEHVHIAWLQSGDPSDFDGYFATFLLTGLASFLNNQKQRISVTRILVAPQRLACEEGYRLIDERYGNIGYFFRDKMTYALYLNRRGWTTRPGKSTC